MASLHIILCLVIGIYHSYSIPIPTSHFKQKEIKPESELRFGYGMSFQYHGQMLHGLNRHNLLVGLEIPDLRIPNYYTPTQDMYSYEENNNYVKKIINLKLRFGTKLVLMYGQLFKQLLEKFMT